MAVTRDQARRLLSDSEMTLFSESRNPALRAISAAGLTRRVERTRKLRDKSRDLLQRQRLGSRDRTGSKAGSSGVANERTQRKSEVLGDILQRFEGRLQEVQQADGQAAEAGGDRRNGAPAASNARKQAAKTLAAKKAPKRTTQAPAPSARTTTSSNAAASASKSSRASKTTAGTAVATTTAIKARRARKPAITPEQALAQTRELLEAKQQRDRQPPAYRMLDAHAEPGQPEPGYQSATAKDKAQELHAGEVRIEPIHGSIGTRGRQNQGKRDHR